jgi:hypothetical protein
MGAIIPIDAGGNPVPKATRDTSARDRDATALRGCLKS